ncbi:MAG TPA: cell division protein ZapA [bacterium]|nr:cell division protein ZapA [bacterium]
MKKSHVVTILNQKLIVRSDASDEAVAEVAGLVESRIQEILDGSKSASLLVASLLACLNFAEELRDQKRLRGAAGHKAAEKVREMIRMINTHLEDGVRKAL